MLRTSLNKRRAGLAIAVLVAATASACGSSDPEGHVPDAGGSGVPDSGHADAGPYDGGSPPLPDAGDAAGDAATDPPGNLDVRWMHGSADCADNMDPPLQVHRYDEDTFILRQNKCLDYEAPFLYLLFGRERVLLEDTGATSSASTFPLAETIRDIIADVLSERGQEGIDLIVAHSHGHGDHVAADGQFSGQLRTMVVGTDATAVAQFFGIASWPLGTAELDLGERTVDVIPIPGHEDAHVAFYDRNTGILLTGDSLYPGRLYVSDWDAYRASMARLHDFAAARKIAHVLGTHIEMTDQAGIDYPIGTTYQPEEHALALGLEHLALLDESLQDIGAVPQRRVLDDFIIDP